MFCDPNPEFSPYDDDTFSPSKDFDDNNYRSRDRSTSILADRNDGLAKRIEELEIEIENSNKLHIEENYELNNVIKEKDEKMES